jgi:hypothetical protein
MGPQKTSRQMKRGRQAVGGETTDAAIRRHEKQARLCLQQVVEADGAGEVSEVGAAAHADVLADIEHLAAGGVGEGAGPSAEAVARFQEGDAKAARGQRRRGGKAGQTGAEDGNVVRQSWTFREDSLFRRMPTLENGLAKPSFILYRKW